MSDMRPKGSKITLNGTEYNLIMGINIIDDIQDTYDIAIGEITDLINDPKKQFKVIRHLFTSMINEDIDRRNDSGEKLEHITEQYFGRHFDMSNPDMMRGIIYKSLNNSMPEHDSEEDEDPNAKSV